MSEFIDRLCEQAGEHPEESDGYWDEFWRLKEQSNEQGTE
jgi:hypothetical protein